TANFAAIRTLTVSETGNGQVTSSPAGINCSPISNQCSAGFPDQTIVTLTPAANSGFTFAGWGGACSAFGTGTCQITISADTNVSATFNAIPNFTLSVAKNGTGSGTVLSTPLGINCGATCATQFASGTQLTLMATPSAGSAFTGWTASVCSGSSTCNFTI